MTATNGSSKLNGSATPSSVFHRTLDSRLPMAQRASGNYIYLADGTKILDASGGAAVVSIGHGVPEVVEAVSAQIGTIAYVSSAVFGIEPAEELASLLCEEGGFGRAVFYSGGSEAVESAIKLCRQYHVENGQPERTKFISREISYHGNTLGALALGRHDRRRAHFMPLLPDVYYSVSACNAWRFKLDGESDEVYVSRLAKELDDKIRALGPKTVAAFFVEPIVGAASGCVPFVPGYLKAMRQVCHSHGVLFACDEIMCGAGRSGRFYAWSHDGEEARPDVMTLGKGLCGGYAPLSAVMVAPGVVEVLQRGSGAFVNGYTFQSSGAGTAAGLAVFKYIKKHDLLVNKGLADFSVENCAKQGELLARLLREHVLPLKHVGDVRGMGLFWGVELVREGKEPYPYEDGVNGRVANELLSRGVAVYHGAGSADGWTGDHIMICPPYTVTDDELRTVAEAVRAAVIAVLGD